MASVVERLRASAPWLRSTYERSRVVVWAFVGSRLVVLLALFIARWLAREPSPPEFAAPPWWAPVRALASWDAGHYLAIAAGGYNVGSELALDRFAFFPLWPLGLRVLDVVLPIGLFAVGVLGVHVLALAAALRLKAFVARETGSPRTGDRAAVYLLVFPSAFVLSMPYAEALFLLLSIAFLDLVRQGRWGSAAALGLLAGLTRPGGWVLAVPAAWEGIRVLFARRDLPDTARAAVATAAPPAGFAAYLLYAGWRTGDVLTPLERQWREGWKVRPRFFLDSALDKADQIGELGVTPDVVLGIVVLIAFAFALYTFRVLPGSMAAYAAAAVALGASTHVIIGVTRVVMAAVPLFWALAILGERRGFDAAWRPVSLGLMGALAVAAFAGVWVP